MKPYTIAASIAICGAAGALTRYAICSFAERHWGSFSSGTLIVNLAGCFLLGALLQIASATHLIPPPWPAIIGIGFLGALTTFSTFGAETFVMLTGQQLGAAVRHVGLHIVLGVAAIWAGDGLVRGLVTAVAEKSP